MNKLENEIQPLRAPHALIIQKWNIKSLENPPKADTKELKLANFILLKSSIKAIQLITIEANTETLKLNLHRNTVHIKKSEINQ